MFSPFGLGVLDIGVGNFVLEAARSSGAAMELPDFFSNSHGGENMNDFSSQQTSTLGVEPSEPRVIGQKRELGLRDYPLNTAHPRVWSCNEWDQLEEVIVGNPLNARFPTPDRSTQVAEYPDRSLAEIPRGLFPQQIIDETEEDLNEFAEILKAVA